MNWTVSQYPSEQGMSGSFTEHKQPLTPLLARGEGGVSVLSRIPEVNRLLQMALEEARRLVKAKYADFYFFDSRGQLEPFSSLPDGETEDSRPSSMRDAVLQASRFVLERRESYNLGGSVVAGGGDLSSEEVPPALPEEQEPLPVLPFPLLATPLLAPDRRLLGALVLSEPLYFESFFHTDLALIRDFADTFSLILCESLNDPDSHEIFLKFKTSLLLLMENAQLHQKIKESDQQLRAVLEVSNLINSSRELDEMVEAILYSARRVARAESATLFMRDEETGELFFHVISGEKENELAGVRIPEGKGIAGKAALDKKPILVNDAQSDERLYRNVDQMSHHTTRNLIAAPLLVNDRPIGVIEVLNTIDRFAFSEHDVEIFQSFADAVAIAIQRRRLLDDIQTANAQLEKKLKEVTSLHSVTEVLVDARTVEELFSSVLSVIITDLDTRRVSITLRENSESDPVVSVEKGAYESEDGARCLREAELVRYVFRTGNSLFFDGQPQTLSGMEESVSGLLRDFPPAMMFPLYYSSMKDPFGVLFVGDPASGRFFEEDRRLINTITSQMVRGYENIHLTMEILAKEAMEKEVEITSKIQKNILPDTIPSHSFFEMSARSVMARTIGGDFYDYYIHEKNGEATFLVADVSGKSLPAALFMAISSSILRTIIRAEEDPVEILRQANDLLYEESQSGMFVTVFLARYEPDTGLLRFASAGHNEMLLLHSDGSYEMLSGKGAPLGVLPTSMQTFKGGDVRVREGDTLVLYTDGVVEAVNQKEEEYGLSQFLRNLQENIQKTPEEMIQLIYQDVISFSGSDLQFDDFTMLVTKFRTSVDENREYHITLPARVESVPVLRDFITRISHRHGLAGEDLEDILISVDEASTNIILHAFSDKESEASSFQCNLFIETGRLFRVEFVDDGKFFSLDQVQEPSVQENLTGRRKGGFGVFLIRSLMNHVEYRREGGRNVLTAEKFLETPSALRQKKKTDSPSQE